MANPFLTYLKERLPLVEKGLAAAADSPLFPNQAQVDDLNQYLYAPLAAFTQGGGKRVRPVLCLLGAEAAGAAPEAALAPAVAVELFQSAALIHDDIADESDLRRGEPCLYRVHGTGLAINMGDLSLTQVFEVVLADASLDAKAKVRLLDTLVKMERHTLEGQALDLGWARDERWDITEKDYWAMVVGKTAYYTAASPLVLGAICAGASQETLDELSRVGLCAGVAFQIQDDLLNLVGDPAAQGKDLRSDITEGKRTLAVVYALEHLDEKNKAQLIELLGSGTTDAAELTRAVDLIELGGGIEYCRQVAQDNIARAKEAARLSAAAGHITVEASELLVSMADFFVERAG